MLMLCADPIAGLNSTKKIYDMRSSSKAVSFEDALGRVPNALLLTTYRGFTPGGSVAANIISLRVFVIAICRKNPYTSEGWVP
jgi:hypothetical protein